MHNGESGLFDKNGKRPARQVTRNYSSSSSDDQESFRSENTGRNRRKNRRKVRIVKPKPASTNNGQAGETSEKSRIDFLEATVTELKAQVNKGNNHPAVRPYTPNLPPPGFPMNPPGPAPYRPHLDFNYKVRLLTFVFTAMKAVTSLVIAHTKSEGSQEGRRL